MGRGTGIFPASLFIVCRGKPCLGFIVSFSGILVAPGTLMFSGCFVCGGIALVEPMLWLTLLLGLLLLLATLTLLSLVAVVVVVEAKGLVIVVEDEERETAVLVLVPVHVPLGPH